jgi:hypothetical protein
MPVFVKNLLSVWGRLTALSLVLIAILAGSTFAQSQLIGDLDGNYRVDFKDLRMFSWQWLDPDCLIPGCIGDLDGVNGVNMADLALLVNNWQVEEPHLVISEFMASNASSLPLGDGELLDGNGESSDWIEIYNPSGTDVNLAGWYLTDSASNLMKWEFPNGLEIKPGEFLIIFASDKTHEKYPLNYPYLDDDGYYHTNFELDKDTGEYLALVAPNGTTIVHDYAPQFPIQLTDVSYGLTQYGATLVSAGATTSYHVPTSGDAGLGTGWTEVDFNDLEWDSGQTGIGFGLGGERMIAYNDCVYSSGDQYIANNVTTYGIGSGNPGLTSGPLVDQATGDDMGVTVTLTESGGVNWQPSTSSGGSDCAVGTDAHYTFGGTADMTGVIHYGSAGWWVDLTFTGLNPTTEYTFATSASRGNSSYSNRLTIYTLTGADTYTNASTSGVDVLAENKVRFITGDNHNEGYVARWTGITAADGSFTVRAEADPNSANGYKAYSFDVFMLEGGSRGTDVQSDMLGVNASLWMRSEFNLEEGESEIFDTLTLRMKYEDGFAAYLNGQPATSRNAPNSVQWDSTALSNRPDANASAAEVINILSSVHALQDGRNVLAIHGLNDNAADPNFLILPELTAASNMSVPQYFTTPTPKTFNVPGAKGIADEVWFSHKRGFYDTPFQLILSTGDDNAVIRYTRDGSWPTITHGFTYSSPIGVGGTGSIRAVAVKPGYLDSEVEAHTYIFVDDVVLQDYQATLDAGLPSSWGGTSPDYGMDPDVIGQGGTDLFGGIYTATIRNDLKSIPTLSILMDVNDMFGPLGIYTNSTSRGLTWERPGSAELIYPTSTEGFQINCGVRIQGGWFRQHSGTRKHSLRLLFKRIYGETKLRYPWFGEDAVDYFDTIVLRAGANDGYSWSSAYLTEQYTRDNYGRSLQRATGNAGSHGTFVHLYINGIYWGLYNPVERPDEAFSASYYGGNKEDWDSLHDGSAHNGNKNFWNQMLALCIQAQSSNAAYMQLQGNNLDGTPNPNYPHLLDVPNYIDYLIVNLWGGNWDWPWKNWWAGRHQSAESTGFKFYCWDYENTMGNNRSRSPLNKNALNNNFSSAGEPHQSLKINAEYRMLFADRVHKFFFNSAILTPESLTPRYEELAARVERSIVAESARWGDQHHNPPLTLQEWYNERGWILNTYLPDRTDIVLQHFIAAALYPSVPAPIFSINGSYQHGGQASSGDQLTMDIPPSGTIYYTIDGSDPREPLTGNVNVGGIPYAPITLNKSRHIKARVLDGGTWSALNEAVYSVGPVAENLRITEIMYHPQDTGDPNDPNTEFIELKNIGASTLNLNLVKFTEGIHFTFPDTQLDPDECIVVVRDQSAFEAKYGTSVNMAGSYIGGLANNGERIKLQDAAGRTILDFEYKDGWRSITDGDGFSLTIIEPGDSAIYSSEDLVAHWKFDDGSGGTATDSAGTNNGTLVGDTTWTAGRINGALSFDGAGDYVSAASVAPLAGDTLTAQAWIRVSEYAGIWNPILTQNVGGNGYYFYVSSSRPAFYIVVGAAFVQAISFETINADQWYNVAGTNDGSKLKLYIDGQLEDSTTSTGFLGVSSNVNIGREPVSPLYYYGLIDDVRIYDRAVSESEFQDIADPMRRWSQKSSWRASVYRNGTPGADDSGILPNPGAVVINEVMAHSNAGPDWIELHNTTSKPINIGGWFLSDDNKDEPNLMKYRIPDGTTIALNGYIVFYEDTDFNNPGDPCCLIPFALSENGEEVCLSSHLDPNGYLTGYRQIENFGASQTNVSLGRYYKPSTGNFNFVAMDYNTPDVNNANPRVGPVVINEIMYNPPTGNQNEEYIELHNITGALVTLYRYDKSTPWKFTDGIDYTFNPSPVVTIPAYDYLILAKDLTAFTARYGVISGVQVVEGYSGRLSNAGERLQIGMPGDIDGQGTRQYIRIDRVTYSDGWHPEDCPGGVDLWPTEADGLGKSLSRKVTTDYGNDVANWQAATPSPGTANP